MDVLTALVRLVEALVWPLFVAGVMYWHRREIEGLVSHLRQFEAGGVKFAFQDNLREAREIAEEADIADYKRDPSGWVSSSTPEEERLIASLDHPRSAILVAWRGVEEAVKRAANQRISMSPMPDLSSPRKALRALREIEEISEEDVDLFHELRGLKDQVANVESFQPTEDAALEYLDLAGQLRARLERLAQPRYSKLRPDQMGLPLEE